MLCSELIKILQSNMDYHRDLPVKLSVVDDIETGDRFRVFKLDKHATGISTDGSGSWISTGGKNGHNR